MAINIDYKNEEWYKNFHDKPLIDTMIDCCINDCATPVSGLSDDFDSFNSLQPAETYEPYKYNVYVKADDGSIFKLNIGER